MDLLIIEDRRVIEKLMKCINENKSVATVTITKTDDSAPRGVGSLMLVDEEGNLLEGTIGGGILEEKGKEDAVRAIREKRSFTVEYSLGRPSKAGNTLPALCGGSISLFVKPYNARDHLVIVGAGHVGEKLAKIANILEYNVTVLDDREERLNSCFFPRGENLMLGDIVENLRKIHIDNNTYIVIVTYGHIHDQRALEAVIRSRAKYIGMIGSKNKVKTCFNNLLKKGYLKEEMEKVYTPIGLDLGGETPEEIALGILAEIQAVKYNKDVPHLKGDISEYI